MTTLLSSFKPNPSYAVAEEATLRQNADGVLQSNINAEASTRQSADLSLQNSINSEITARQSAIATLQTTVNGKVNTSDIGVTVASLVGGTIPSGQLPSFVDDVLEFNNLASFPVTGESGKIYVAKDTNKTYRWSGSAYIFITSGAVDSVNGKTGVVVLAKSDVGLGSVDNTADANKNVLSATKLTTARTVAVSGDVSGSVSFDGSANATINTTLANSGVSAGTYKSVSVDAKGRVTGGSNPTTLAGYGITDAYPLSGGNVNGTVISNSATEGQIGTICTGQQVAYLYNNSSSWGLYSGAGGSILTYIRATGKVFINNIDTSTLVKNDGATYNISISGNANYATNAGYASSAGSVPSVNVLSSIASANAGDVGTYVFGMINGTAIYIGNTYSGSSIVPSGVYSSDILGLNEPASGTRSSLTAGSGYLSGTWKAMGSLIGTYPDVNYSRAVLFLRVA